MDRIKVLLIQEVLQRYRAPIYRLMAKEVDLTLAYTVKNNIDDPELRCIALPHYKIGPFYIHTSVYKILNQYDVVIMQPHLRAIGLNMVPYFPHVHFKIVTWTIGVHVTYDCPYDLSKRPSVKNIVFENIQDTADACIFYMPAPIEYWKKYKGINENKYFVAHNTVEVAEFGELPPFARRDSFLFVGTLYRQKGIGELLEAYKLAKGKQNALPKLNIVGNGPEKDVIEQQIKDLGISDDVILCGAIYDEEILKNYFLKALLCISPKQAGLSVPKSLGYGCPFVTHPNAITGGERDNIINGVNSIYYNTVEELAEVIVDTSVNPGKYDYMSRKAREYYLKECSPQIMANGALDAIKYVLKTSK